MTYYLDDSLVRDSLELARSIDRLLSEVVCKLENSNKVAYTEAKVYCGFKDGLAIAA